MRFKRTTVITAGLVSFLAGLGFARYGRIVSAELLISFGIVCLVTIVRLRWLAIISTVLFAFMLGWFRGQSFAEFSKQLASLNGVKATAVVRATSDATYNDRGQLSFDASELNVIEPFAKELPGKLSISGFGEPAVFKGDTVQITGKFYASRGSRQLVMSFAQIDVLERGESEVDDLRRRFSAGMQSSVPEPEASFGLGLLIGQRTTIPEDLKIALSAVGLTHIIAVSGYNLTIIMRAVKRLMKNRSKYQTAVISLALIGLFLAMTGMSASIVRAAIVSGLSIAAWYYGRTFKPILLICLVGAITAGVNPFYLWSDIGWWLSFLAFFGVLVLSPLINARLFKTKEPRTITALLSESFSAVVMTAPLVMYIFGQISLIALPANLIIVPFVPLAMLLSLIAGLAGMFLPNLAGILAWPATIIMTFMLDVVHIISRLPYILAERSLSVYGMIFTYLAILFVIFVLWQKTSKNVKITDTITAE